jgi:hypothetical protein
VLLETSSGVLVSYWWVNQNQTFKQEFEGGYLWSPQRRRDGARNRYYDNMREVQRGDVVVSYADQRLRAIGVAASGAYEAPKPDEFPDVAAVGAWSRIGWRVDVAWRVADAVVRPKSFLADIVPLLPDKYAPLTAAGDGLQSVYLAALPHALGELLVARLAEAGVKAPPLHDSPGADDNEAEWRESLEREELAKLEAANIPDTERKALAKARLGQGLYRKRLMSVEKRCRVSGVSNTRYLIASHIWPWRHASNGERLDGENGLLLTPSIDFIFDRGLISFEDDGTLLVSPVADTASLARLGVTAGQNVGPFTSRQREFLRRHREGHGGIGGVFRKVPAGKW